MKIRTVIVVAGSLALGFAAPTLFAQGAKAPLTNPGATNAKSQQQSGGGQGQEPNVPQSSSKKTKSGPDLTGQPGVGQSKQKEQKTSVQKMPKQMSGGQSGGGQGDPSYSSQWKPKGDTKNPASAKNAASSKAAQMNK